MNMFSYHRKHTMYHATYDGDRKRYEWFKPVMQAVTAFSGLVGAAGSAKSAFGDQPKPAPAPPAPQPAAAVPAADEQAARYAAQRRVAALPGSRASTNLTGRRKPGVQTTMLG